VKVVFLEDVEGSGRIGEIKEVANGFARNYLLPRRLAAAATPAEIRRGEALAEKEARRQAVLDEEATGVAEKLTGALITISARVGEQGRLYGSVTAADIAEEVSKLAGRQIEHRQVLLAEPLKELGTQEIGIRLTRNVEASVQVEVVSEEAPIAAEPAAAEAAEEETEAEVSEAEADAEAQVEAEAEPEEESEQESLEEEREPDG
jgi:large subunit ribosomal protein L9